MMEDGTQNYLAFQPLIKYFELSKTINPIVVSWKSKGNYKSIKRPTATNNILNPKLDYFNIPKFWVKFESSCLKTVLKPFTPNKTANFYIDYKMKLWSYHKSGKFTARNSLFRNVNLTKNADPDKYFHSGCGITFDIQRNFSLRNGSFGRNVIIFGADMSSSVHVDNKIKDILILFEGQTQGLDDAILTAVAEYSINFTEHENKFCFESKLY